jgi:DNA-directed RNA polymerase subunit RPC12/RpoP
MERIYNCVNCTKPFKVMNELPEKPAHLPEVELAVDCPFCETSNIITWPARTNCAVTPQ